MRTTTSVYYVIRLSGKTRQAGAPKNRQRFLSIRPGFPRDGVERRSTVSNLSLRVINYTTPRARLLSGSGSGGVTRGTIEIPAGF